jgi:hypothetical protein
MNEPKWTKEPWIFNWGCFYAEVQLDENKQTYEKPIAEMCGGREEDYKENVRLISSATQLYDALKQCEWNGFDSRYIGYKCPICGEYKEDGHAPYCELATALKAAERGYK